MRRALLGLTAACTLLALAAPASAAPAQVTSEQFSGPLGFAVWTNTSATSETDTVLGVSTGPEASVSSGTGASRETLGDLFIDQYTANLDVNHHFTGATDTRVDVTSGFSFIASKEPLASASLNGSGLPATTCTYDASFNQIGCTATTIDATVAWTGQGPILRDVSTEHFKSEGFNETTNQNGAQRDATATGTVGGVTLTASDLFFAVLQQTNHFVDTTVCIGASC